jgi:beta-glucanase (GH16 family)
LASVVVHAGIRVQTPLWHTSSPTPILTPTPTSTPPSEPSKWNLALADDFNGTDLDPLLWRKYGETWDWPGHAGHGLRVGRAVSVENGAAVITAKEVDNVIESGAFTPRSVHTTYGRYEARVRTLPDPSGVMSGVVLTWPTSNNQPPEGELDFYETGRQRVNFKSFVHYGATNSQIHCTHLEDPTQWHDVAMEWEPDRLEIFVDGTSRCEWTDPTVIPDWQHRVTFQYDAFADDMGSTVTRMEIDWAKMWTPAA